MGPEAKPGPQARKREQLVVPYLEGQGVGPEIMTGARRLIDEAVRHCYGDRHLLSWLELPRFPPRTSGGALPQELLHTLRAHRVALKGPLTTPVGGGHRSWNVELRRRLDLYCCLRPARSREGLSLLRQTDIDLVVFRETTEDVYCSLEFAADSPQARQLRALAGDGLAADSAVGLKVMSRSASKRFFRRVLRWSHQQGRHRVTIVHKGNIMKQTEGGFLRWCLEVLEEPEFAADFRLVPCGDTGQGSAVLVDERLADAMFQQLLTRPDEYDVLAAPNLNGDYLAEAAGALAGGLALQPSANLGDGRALFEPAHGTASHLAGRDRANPTAQILAGCMLLDFAGLTEAAAALRQAVDKTLAAGIGTPDLVRTWHRAGRPGREAGTTEFVEAIANRLPEEA